MITHRLMMNFMTIIKEVRLIKNALIDLAQKRKELDYKQANNQQLKDTTLDGVRAVIGGGLEGASFHPILNIPYIGTGLGGALFEWSDSINNKRSAIDTLKNMGKGFVVGETVGAIPYAGKAIGKTKVGGKSVDVPDYTTVNFTNKNLGKDYIHNLPEYPTLFDQLAGSKYAFSTNYKNEPDRLYDHLVNTNNNRLFDYLIEVIKDNDGNIHHNYKIMKNITKGDKP